MNFPLLCHSGRPQLREQGRWPTRPAGDRPFALGTISGADRLQGCHNTFHKQEKINMTIERDLVNKVVEDVLSVINRTAALSEATPVIYIAAAAAALYQLAVCQAEGDPVDLAGLVIAGLAAAHFSIDPVTASAEAARDLEALIEAGRVQR
jgi:hypothetical protein